MEQTGNQLHISEFLEPLEKSWTVPALEAVLHIWEYQLGSHLANSNCRWKNSPAVSASLAAKYGRHSEIPSTSVCPRKWDVLASGKCWALLTQPSYVNRLIAINK